MADRPRNKADSTVVSLADERRKQAGQRSPTGREMVHVPTTDKAMAPVDDIGALALTGRHLLERHDHPMVVAEPAPAGSRQPHTGSGVER